jgi:methionine-R-sulfoxide reductase
MSFKKPLVLIILFILMLAISAWMKFSFNWDEATFTPESQQTGKSLDKDDVNAIKESKMEEDVTRNNETTMNTEETTNNNSETTTSATADVVVKNDADASCNSYTCFTKPSDAVLRAELSDIAYNVTQQEGTERAGTSLLDKIYEDGIYVDIVSGEPLFSSKDKFDSGTGWPSFVKPISNSYVALLEDKKLFSTRTEVRSIIADSHLGHVFDDGPDDRGGKRWCMNGAALRFIPKAELTGEYAQFASLFN